MVLHAPPRLRDRLVRAAACVAVASLAGACDRVPLTAPSGTAITLIATANSLPADGSMDVIAVLIEGGIGGGNNPGVEPGVGTTVHDGTVVTFTTTLGRIEPVEARTKDGRVTVRLVGDGRTGTAVVTAISGPAIGSIEIAVGDTGG